MQTHRTSNRVSSLVRPIEFSASQTIEMDFVAFASLSNVSCYNRVCEKERQTYMSNYIQNTLYRVFIKYIYVYNI